MKRLALVAAAALVMWAVVASAQVGPSDTGGMPIGGGTFSGPVGIGVDSVLFTGDGDGAVSLLGQGDGFDETLTLNLDDRDDIIGFSSPGALSVEFDFRLAAWSISAAESFKYGFAVIAGADTNHDIDVAAGFAESWDRSTQINAAALAGKQLDVAWTAGAANGMLGEADQVGATAILTFSRTANPDTITSDEASFTLCNDGGSETGTVLIGEGSTNNGIFEIVSCTDTVLSIANDTLPMDETGDADEYVARFIVPNTWYHVFVIELADAEDYCIDRSREAATCLSESTFDMWRFLTSRFVDGSGNIFNP